MDLNSLIIIDKIDSLGSFSAAAKALKMPNSNLSLKVKQLEEHLGQPLFTRSTRQVVITAFGRTVLNHSKPIIEIKRKIEALAEEAIEEPSGSIRMTAPYDVGLYLLRSIIPRFTARYEKIQIEVELSNVHKDLISGNFDLAIRATASRLVDSSAIAFKLGSTSMGLYTHRDTPWAKIKRFQQLEKVPLLSMSEEICLSNEGESQSFHASSRIRVIDMTGIKHAVLGKAGVGVLPEFICSDEHTKKVLINLFPEWTAAKALFYAVYPKNSSLTPKNRAFIEFLKEQFEIKSQ